MSHLEREDPELYAAIEGERRRQVEKIELIASENYTSPAVMEAVGSVLTNKYAEGYPGRRYYGGCEWVDVAETLAIERAKALFGAAAVNVQPHAGAQANMAAYAAVMQPGDTMLGLALDQGGHLTHGSPVNFSAKLYKVVPYHVRRDDDAQDAPRPARRHDPQRRRVREADQQRGVPEHPGRSAHARDRGQGGHAQGGGDARVQGVRQADQDEREDPGRVAGEGGSEDRFWGNRQPPHARGCAAAGAHRQEGREGARRRRHHGEQEHDPL